MQFVININTDNAAFGEIPGQVEGETGKALELARILNAIAERLENGELEGNIIDFNGNTVGEFYENLCEIE
jgi:hypothetical protein